MSTRFLVSGMVQGVGFRWFVARHARALGLAGYAKNLPDGRVEVVVSGPNDALPALERLLRTGPANAQVYGLERSAEPDTILRANSFDII
jgi:acylphosphatase